MKNLLTLSVFIFWIQLSFANKEKPQFLEDLWEVSDSSVRIENSTIIGECFSEELSAKLSDSSIKSVLFVDVNFTEETSLMLIKKEVIPILSFINVSNLKSIWLFTCNLNKGLTVSQSKDLEYLQISNSEIRERLNFYENSNGKKMSFKFINSNFINLKGLNMIYSTIDYFKMNNCNVQIANTFLELNLSGNKFLLDSVKVHGDLLLKIDIEKDLKIKNSFLEMLSVNYINFPASKNVYMPWGQFNGGFNFSNYLFKSSSFDFSYQFWKYDGFKLDDYTEERHAHLIALYYEYIRIQKDRGDYQSYSKSIIKLEDIRTGEYFRKAKLEGNNMYRLKGYFNLFLKYYSSYCTSISKSLRKSIEIVFMFALLYLLGYKRWGKGVITLKSFFNEWKNYIFSNSKIYDVVLKLYKDSITLKILTLKEKPNKIVLFFSNLIDKQRDRVKWHSKNRKAKLILKTFFLLNLIVFFAVRLLKSLSLSFNVFSTLGFGNMPVRGSLMYIAIFEGFIGWFLLSIFSVTLFNQLVI